ncbi:MAG: DUF3488 domain-containing protein [Acidobacteria bacterium]|nr:DUF3488 domain-containing protein [Acidobacteriota bacterium]
MKLNSLENYFKLCSYLLITQGFATIAFTGNVDIISIILYPIALLLSWHSDKPSSRLQIKPQTANWLALSFIPFIYIDFRYISSSYIGPLIHYSLFISIFNLFKVKVDRDWVFLYLIAVFEVLLAATLTIDITYIIMLGIFLLLTLATLEAFEIKRSQGEVYQPREEKLLNRLGRLIPLRRIAYLVSVTVTIVFLIGLIAAPIFLLIPRFNTNLMARSFGATTVSITGFSEVVELGQLGEIKKSEQVVMNVRLKNNISKLKKFPKWRGVTLSNYSGRSWSEPRKDQRRALRLTDGVYKITEPSANTELLEQTFYLEPLSSPVVFAASKPLNVNNQLPSLYRAPSETLTTSDHSLKQIVYTVFSDVSSPNVDDLNRDNQAYGEDIQAYYLQIPEMDSKVSSLAKEITKNLNTRLEKAQAIERYLKTQYSYSLEMRRTEETDPLVDFLFNTRQGHCEYFATSMVIMLRNLGIAARMVNGFQSGEYNEVNNTFTVRQSEAHSWVEVYFPATESWVEFDPTPAAGFSQYGTGLSAKLKKYASALRMLWLDYVVTYDSERQSYLSTKAKDIFSSYKGNIEETVLNFRQYLRTGYKNFLNGNFPSKELAVAIALLVVTGLGILTWYFINFSKEWHLNPNLIFSSWWGKLFLPLLRWRNRSNPQQSAIIFYNEMLVALERKGFKKKSFQTPLEFALETKLQEVEEITNQYNFVRFNDKPLSNEENQQIRALIKQLVKKKVAAPIPMPKQRQLVLTSSIAALLVLSSIVGIYFYNEQKIEKNSRWTRNQLIRFSSQSYEVPAVIKETTRNLRVEPGNGALEVFNAFKGSQSTDISPKGKLPWDDYFDPVNQPTKDELEILFQRPEVTLLEKAATRKDFSFYSLDKLSEEEINFLSRLDYSLVVDRVDLLLWKAYVAFREGKSKDCERMLALVISLGDRLRQDYSINNALLGYMVMSRGGLAMAKYYISTDRTVEAKKWFELVKYSSEKRTKLIQVSNEIRLAGISDKNLTELFSLALLRNEPAVAQAAVISIGKNWLSNPNQVVVGISDRRRSFLSALAKTKFEPTSTMAKNYLDMADKMSLQERWQSFSESYSKKP